MPGTAETLKHRKETNRGEQWYMRTVRAEKDGVTKIGREKRRVK